MTMLKKLKHWLGVHEWQENGYKAYSGQYLRIESHICTYPGCEATSLYDTRDELRFGVKT